MRPRSPVKVTTGLAHFHHCGLTIGLPEWFNLIAISSFTQLFFVKLNTNIFLYHCTTRSDLCWFLGRSFSFHSLKKKVLYVPAYLKMTLSQLMLHATLHHTVVIFFGSISLNVLCMIIVTVICICIHNAPSTAK